MIHRPAPFAAILLLCVRLLLVVYAVNVTNNVSLFYKSYIMQNKEIPAVDYENISIDYIEEDNKTILVIKGADDFFDFVKKEFDVFLTKARLHLIS